MASVFTKVIEGELPGRIVYSDDQCAAFLTIAPLRMGHLLVVPRVEIDSWLDLPPDLLSHLTAVARRMGEALREVTSCARVGLIIAGFELAHAHLHVIPTESMDDLDFSRVDTSPDPAAMDEIADRIRVALGA